MRFVSFAACAVCLALALPSAAADNVDKKKKEKVDDLGSLDSLPLEPLPLPAPPTAKPPAPAAKPPAPAAKPPAPAAAESAKPAAKGASGTAAVPSPPPPLLKLATQFGIVFQRGGAIDDAAAAEVESGLRGIAFQAPMSQKPIVLRTPNTPCPAEDDGCFATLGTQEGVDDVVVATARRADNALELRVRHIDVVTRKRLGEAKRGGLTTDRLEVKAVAEALLCKQIVPLGCTGEALIEAQRNVQLLVDGALVSRSEVPERLKLPVGVHSIRAQSGGKQGPERLLTVLREAPTGASLVVRNLPDGAPQLLTPAELSAKPISSAPAAALAAAPVAPTQTRWTRPAGIALAAVGGLAALAGSVQGARSKSLISDAEKSYSANGGAYRAADLSTLQSGNSAAKSANALFVVGGVLIAAGLVTAVAF